MDDDSHNKFYAKKEYILEDFTDVLRDLMRAISAENNYAGGLNRATYKMNHVNNKLKLCEEPITWHELFSYAVEQLRDLEKLDEYKIMHAFAAQAGMSMLAEMTCSDSATNGRVSKKQDNFVRRMRHALKRLDPA